MKAKRAVSPLSLKVSSSVSQLTNRLAHTVTMQNDSSNHNHHHHHQGMHYNASSVPQSSRSSNNSLVESMRRMIFKSKVREQQSNVWTLIDVDMADDDMMRTSSNAFAATTAAATATTSYEDDRRFVTTYIDQHVDDDDVLKQTLNLHHDYIITPIDDIPVLSFNPFLSPGKASTFPSTTTPLHHHTSTHHPDKRHPRMDSTDQSFTKGYLSLRANKELIGTVIRSLNLRNDDEVRLA